MVTNQGLKFLSPVVTGNYHETKIVETSGNRWPWIFPTPVTIIIEFIVIYKTYIWEPSQVIFTSNFINHSAQICL